MIKTLHRIGRDDFTVHGFRSSFRDWVEETTNYSGAVAEAASAHVVGDKVEAAYRRGDLFEKRRKLMAAWGPSAPRRPRMPRSFRSAASRLWLNSLNSAFDSADSACS
jgi:hypothetical protein